MCIFVIIEIEIFNILRDLCPRKCMTRWNHRFIILPCSLRDYPK